MVGEGVVVVVVVHDRKTELEILEFFTMADGRDRRPFSIIDATEWPKNFGCVRREHYAIRA